ncbi:response regulator [Paucibacter sp. R3-3]|uniref:histidine kinase n=1 Tax=Roseateles agri TaxID=3098619 RepID=A0ABU5DS08_9BURK|nr:response regulator [Paucibacter sp. R3-3]MDY0749111.1 response regulator [Paucibacter sp. R3-3]
MATSSKDPYRFFRIEAAELQDQLGAGILALEKGDDAGTLPLLLRLAHTLKGAARVVRLQEIAEHAHALEDILAPLRDSGAKADRTQINRLLALHDKIGAAVAALGATPVAMPAKAAAAPIVAPVVTGADDGDMVRLLDAVSQAHQQLALLRRSLAQTSATRSAQNLEAALDQMERELAQVHDSAERLRLTPAARLFVPLRRAARDAAQMVGKEVEFEDIGGDVRLDGEVLNLVQGALMQLVRNAVAHGIEPAAARRLAGKPAQGSVSVHVLRQGRRVAFECRDDGAGLNLAALRDKARAKGWTLPGAGEPDTQALLQFLLRGGISTAESVNELAGRGVGLDVVRDAAERLGGEVRLQTEPGRGTTLSLIVPLRLAALETLQVEAGGVIHALPLDAVKQTLRLLPQDIAIGAQGCSVAYQGQSVPYARLADALRDGMEEGATDAQRSSAVIVQGQADGALPTLAALAVDRIVGTAYVTLRDPPELMPAHELLAGVAVDAEGRPQLVLDPDGLCAFARATLPKVRLAEAPKLPVLVIDDSLTTRMLEQSILESAGYAVHAAVSAEEGLEKARQQRYALFLVDVEMPGMDGFTFVERTRADPLLSQVPAMLITSLNSPADKQRGIDVGASGYIVKGEFAQSDFLQKVHQLVQNHG